MDSSSFTALLKIRSAVFYAATAYPAEPHISHKNERRLKLADHTMYKMPYILQQTRGEPFPQARGRTIGHIGGRPKVHRERDRDAKTIRRMRGEGQSYGEIAEELGRSKADIYRVATTLGCESDPGSDASPLSC